MKRVLVLGGHGNFGARICRALSENPFPENDAPDVGVIAAGRRERVDITDPGFASTLRDLHPQIVINCVGPFQEQDYRVARTALEIGAHYIDLADGRAFVAGFAAALDAPARLAGRLAVTGASTLPALSSAVIDALSNRFASMETIEIFIAPAQRAPRGAATLRSVFSYLGKPFKWLEAGEWRTVHGWLDFKRVRIDGMSARWSAACDVPDLEILPARYPTVKTLQFRAALEIGAQQFALAVAAGLVRMGVPLPLDRWAGRLDTVATWLDRFGSALGGMLVRIEGAAPDGSRRRVEWHITADANHGPEIPCMAAILLARKLLRGEIAERGAMPCVGLLTLEEFMPEFARWGMRTVIPPDRT